jgi:hypothetical protein
MSEEAPEGWSIDDLVKAGWREITPWSLWSSKRVFWHPTCRDTITIDGDKWVYQEKPPLVQEILTWGTAFVLFLMIDNAFWGRRKDE